MLEFIRERKLVEQRSSKRVVSETIASSHVNFGGRRMEQPRRRRRTRLLPDLILSRAAEVADWTIQYRPSSGFNIGPGGDGNIAQPTASEQITEDNNIQERELIMRNFAHMDLSSADEDAGIRRWLGPAYAQIADTGELYPDAARVVGLARALAINSRTETGAMSVEELTNDAEVLHALRNLELSL